MILPNRGILAISGEDRIEFLQGLVTNQIGRVPVYACLLTAQGRFLHDFFVIPDGDRMLIDCERDRRGDLMARLKRFRLRAKVEINDVSENFLVCHSCAGGNSDGIKFIDPRHADLGYRCIANNLDPGLRGDDMRFEQWDRTRIMLGIPDGSRDMAPEEALLLENNIGRVNGIDWNKGCYVGQELTARMHYKSGVKRHLTPVRIEGTAPAPGTSVMSGDVRIGEMRSSSGDVGLALLRIDATQNELNCDEAKLYIINKLTPRE